MAKVSDKQAPQKQEAAQKPLQSSNTGALELVVYRNNFYRDNYRRVMVICLSLLVLVGLLGYWGFYERTHQPMPQYFATTFDGKLIPLIPLNQPNLEDNALLLWATESAVAAYTFNFVNYRKALQDIRIFFTKDGYQSFLKALKDSNNLEAVQTKKLVVSAVPTGAPVILNKGIYNDGSQLGVYGWLVELPMVLTYQNANEEFKQNITLTMTIIRMSTLESPKGVGIQSFVVRETR